MTRPHDVHVGVHHPDELKGLPIALDPRFAEHLCVPLLADDGNTSYLLAWMGTEPVGHLNLRWCGNREPEVKAHVVDTPELSQISVWPTELQSRGIGTMLIEAAEAMIRARAFRCVGLGVETVNARARNLYERLGYRDWGHGLYHDQWVERGEDGPPIAHEEPCIYMIKTLSRTHCELTTSI